MRTKTLTTIVAVGGLSFMPVAAHAGEGDATALHIEGVITIADCHAEQGRSNCTALSVLGSEVAGSGQEGAGSSGNTGFGDEDPSGNGGGHLWLFGSQSSVDDNGNSQSSSSAASINIAGQVQLEVLRAQANSNGDAESDGVYLNVGGQEFHILHAQSVGGKGSAAAAVIAGQEVLGSGEDGGVICPLDASPAVIADLICASGRRAGVVDNVDGVGGAVSGEIVTANSRDASAAGPTPTAPSPATPASGSPDSGPDSPLARTGADMLALVLAAAVALSLGEMARRRGGGGMLLTT